MPLNRLHLHPYGTFLICYDPNKWFDAYESIVKSSIAVPKYCLSEASGEDGPGNWEDQFANFAIPDMPAYVQNI